jgi:phage tail-like protein
MADYFPPVGFLFAVDVLGGVSKVNQIDAGFLEISGINTEIGMESIVEGGQNLYSHRVPGRIKNDGPLVLKRGLIAASDSSFGQWCISQLSQGLNAITLNNPIKTKNIIVHLLDLEKQTPLMSWAFYKAYPIKWEISGFNAKESNYVVESISLSYAFVSTLYPKG